MALSLDDFLGLQQSLGNIAFSLGIFMSEYQRKNLLKCTMVTGQSIKEGQFGDVVYESDFWVKPTMVLKKFYIIWE